MNNQDIRPWRDMDAIRRFIGQRQGPHVLELHPGTSCPLRCGFCYNRGAWTYGEDPGEPMAGPELARLLDRHVESGGRELIISGGLEPFDSPHAHTVLELARARQLPTSVYTNGVSPLMGPVTMVLLARSATQVRFSVNAATPETYRRVHRPTRRVQGGLALVRRRVQQLLVARAGVVLPRVGISFLVTAQNYQEIQAAAQLWAGEGVDFISFRADAQEAADFDADGCRQATSALAELTGQGRVGGMAVRITDRLFGPGAPTARRCAAHRVKVVVDPYGRVWRCCLGAQPGRQRARFYLGDLRDRPLNEVLDEAPEVKHCRRCTDFELMLNRTVEAGRRRRTLSYGERRAS